MADSVDIAARSGGRTISFFIFFFKDTAPTEIYPLPLHDALPISNAKTSNRQKNSNQAEGFWVGMGVPPVRPDRHSQSNGTHVPNYRVRGVVDRFIRRTGGTRSEEHTSELQSPCNLVCRLLLELQKVSRGSRAAARLLHSIPRRAHPGFTRRGGGHSLLR